MINKTIAILGLGWLGLPLAESLLKKGYRVRGSVSNEEKAARLSEDGWDVSVLKLFSNAIDISNEDFFDADVLIINFPPARVDAIENIYPNQLRQLLPYINHSAIAEVIFVSSTSVYPEINRTVTEADELRPEKASGIACLEAEKVLNSQQNFETTVIRFGGLIGPGRHPHRFMRPGTVNTEGDKPVNLIVLDDCIGIIQHVIEENIGGEIINACCPQHPTRKDFYTAAAKAAGVEAPVFDHASALKFKIVSSEKLSDQLGYQFKYPNPINYLNETAISS